jgi:hypothetical protein
VNNVRATMNGNGVALAANTNATITNSVLSDNTNGGLDNEGANIFADGTAMAGNNNGVANASGTTFLSNNHVSGNTSNAVNITGGTVNTYGNNQLNGNVVGTLTGASPGLR